ncbi:MAG: M20/M25/M40 family metallo-hydrolase, partial [Chloroflexi bacterium]|nr:M20/M25/M40 family metallo-hydrolase [Chloroflexota bacterium]
MRYAKERSHTPLHLREQVLLRGPTEENDITAAHITEFADRADIAPFINVWQQRHEMVLRDALTIQSIPAPTFHEGERAHRLRDWLADSRLSNISIDEVNNVYARLPGADPSLPGLLVSAHLDTVFPGEVDLRTRRSRARIHGPGLGDNSLGLAAMLNLARVLAEHEHTPPCDIWWVATVGEEGLGDLRGMRAAVDTLGDRLGAAIVLEGIGLGKVYNAGLGVRRLRVDVRGPGGHSWLHPNRPSAVHFLL